MHLQSLYARYFTKIIRDSETIRKTISDSLLAWNHNSEIAKKFWVKDIEFAKKTYNLNKTI